MSLKVFPRLLSVIVAASTLSACFPSDIQGTTADGKDISLMFYPGGNKLDDLIIHDGQNFFGKGQYQIDDPLGDIGFRFRSGERVQAECKTVGKDIMGDDECKRYHVYRSDWPIIPEGSEFDRPEMF